MRIAHFSDVHALALTGVRPWSFFNKRVAGYLNLRLHRGEKHPVALFRALVQDLNRQELDHVVVTGDLTNLSLAPEFALARAVLDELRLGPAAVTVVPGNHDVYTLGALRARLFERVLAPYAESDLPPSPDDRVRFPIVRVRGPLAVIGLSTALPSPPPLADGWLGRRQLGELEQQLAALAGRFRVVALHHPPYHNRVELLRGLRDRRAFAAVLARVGAELVLHGHEHRDLGRTLPGPDGPIPVVGVGSGTYDDPRPERRARYNVYEIVDGRLVAIVARVHDPASGGFVAAESRAAAALGYPAQSMLIPA